jgi:hypothetical protein
MKPVVISVGGWVVGVVDGGGVDSAWLVGGGGGSAGLVVVEQSMGRWGGTELYGGWSPEMDKPVVMVAGGGAQLVGGREEMQGEGKMESFWGKIFFGRN